MKAVFKPVEMRNISRPGLFFRILFFLTGALLSLFTGIVIFFPEKIYHGQGNFIFIAILVCGVGGFAALSWWLFYMTLARYEWDDERIVRYTPLGRTIMYWTEIQRVRIRRAIGDYTYLLHGASGKKLSVDIQLLGENGLLHHVLQAKLARIMDKQIQEIHPESSPSFPITSLGLKVGSIQLSPEYMSQSALLRKKRVVRYSEVKCVYKECQYHSGQKIREDHVLSDGQKDLLCISTLIHDYDTLIRYLRSRLDEAVWVDMSAPVAPSNPDEALAYYRRTQKKTSSEMRERSGVLLFFLILILFLDLRSWMQGIPLRRIVVAYGILHGGLLIVLIDTIWQMRRLKRAKRACQEAIQRLESVENSLKTEN